jgi:DNA-binding transcriptional ArsR family regulator
MPGTTFADLEKLFLALSDMTRVQILALMADGEVPVGYLAEALQQSQPKISRHLAYLRNMGLVTTRRDGKWIYYCIDAEAPQSVKRILTTTINTLRDADASSPALQRDLDQSEDAVTNVASDPGDTDDWQPTPIEIYLL